jgi:sulfatase-like protein
MSQATERQGIAASSRVRMATLVIFINVVGLIVFLQRSGDRLLTAVVDPLHPDWAAMEQALAGFTMYAVSLFGVVLVGALLGARWLLRRRSITAPRAPDRAGRSLPILLAVGLTAVIVLVFIEILVFQDYGVHFYEFDVLGILADAALRRDLGIQPVEVLRVLVAAAVLLLAEGALVVIAARLARWRDGALSRACGAAMLIAVPGGLVLFQTGEGAIESDRAEFEGMLPLGKQLLLRNASRPFIDVRPRLGGAGYPILAATDSAPVIRDRKNIVLYVADGLRGDMVRPELTPNLLAFGASPNVITSRRHLSTGHVSETGIFGLLYGLEGHAFHSFMKARVPALPLEILKRNGYHTFLIASSRLSTYPSDQLIRAFDEVVHPMNDDEAVAALTDYVQARRADGRPYFVLAFFYTPHYPFTSAKPQLRKYPMVGPRARSNYMNDVLQADDYFRQTLALVTPDFDAGRTIVGATSDHGEEIRDHGVFGHAPATFWNEKIVVPFFLGLPGGTLSDAQRRPRLTSHTDLWPTLFDYLNVVPPEDAPRYSDGRSMLAAPEPDRGLAVTGRFFPYAERPSVLVDSSAKYWFRVSDLGASNRLCVVVTRVTDLEDRTVPVDPGHMDGGMRRAFEAYQSTFWRFIEPASTRPRTRRGLSVC